MDEDINILDEIILLKESYINVYIKELVDILERKNIPKTIIDKVEKAIESGI